VAYLKYGIGRGIHLERLKKSSSACETSVTVVSCGGPSRMKPVE
jgi:hypothetical protein